MAIVWFGAIPGSMLGRVVPRMTTRGLSPTRHRAAGFEYGPAGSVGAIGQSMVCAEASSAFVALRYPLGTVLTGAVRAELEPRLLRASITDDLAAGVAQA